MRSTVSAAGGLVWRERDGTVQIAVVHRTRHQDWSLPKGTLKPGEHPLACAYREVVEETGNRPTIGVRLPAVTYPVLTSDGAADKTVRYWAMRAGSGDATSGHLTSERLTSGNQVDEVRWISLDEAPTTLSYRRDVEVVTAFAAMPRPLRCAVLLHHASAAGPWDGPDLTRPLDDAGTAAAERIGDLLLLLGPTRLVAATARRCVQTVEPLGSWLRQDIEPDGGFDPGAHNRAPEATADRLVELADDHGATVVCCSGGVIADTVALLADIHDIDLPSVATPMASAWLLWFHEHRLIATELVSGNL